MGFQIRVINSVLFRPEWLEHLVPIQKMEQNRTIFTSRKISVYSEFSGQISTGMFRLNSMCFVSG